MIGIKLKGAVAFHTVGLCVGSEPMTVQALVCITARQPDWKMITIALMTLSHSKLQGVNQSL